MHKKQWIVYVSLLLSAFIAPTIVATNQNQSSLSQNAMKTLEAHEWDQYVGKKTAIWVDATKQQLHLIEDYQIVQTYRCSTGKAGMGNIRNSGKTPLGWHRIDAKIGSKLPVGAILKGRQFTGRVWKPGQSTKEDLVLTRILWLQGLEKGKNLGGIVDTKRRYIYIHGTNDPENLGKPNSHGCVRLDPAEVIDLYDRVQKNMPVLITGKPTTLEN